MAFKSSKSVTFDSKIVGENKSKSKTMGNEKHLKYGDPEPTFTNKDKLQLLGMRFCPFAQRVRLVLETKKIPYEITNINLTEKPEWLTTFSPLGKVPALGLVNEPNTPWIYEALVIADYLDEKYPELPLYPKDALKKTQDRLLIQGFDVVSSAFLSILMRGVDKVPEALVDLAIGLDRYENELKNRGTVFFGGDRPSMLDLMLWPFCERFGILKHFIGDKYELDTDRYTNMIQWHNIMKKLEAVKETYLPTDIHLMYIDGRIQGNPDYDMVL